MSVLLYIVLCQYLRYVRLLLHQIGDNMMSSHNIMASSPEFNRRDFLTASKGATLLFVMGGLPGAVRAATAYILPPPTLCR